MVGEQAYQSYDGIGALLAGVNLSWTSKYVDTGAVWNWGEATDDQRLLAEIKPLTLTLVARSPWVGPADTRPTCHRPGSAASSQPDRKAL